MVDLSHGRVKPGICCFSVKHAAFERKSIDGIALNQHNVSEWSDKYIYRLLREDYTNPAKSVGLVQCGHLLIEMQLVLAMLQILNISHFALNNNNSL